jgi:hypothetical protein
MLDSDFRELASSNVRIISTLRRTLHIFIFGVKTVTIFHIERLEELFDVITSLVSMEHGVYGCEKVTSLGEVTSNGLA